MGEREKLSPQEMEALFPQMMQATKLLILDYDVTRYHSFDLFHYLLLDEEMFGNCKARYLPFVKEEDLGKKILFYMRNCPNLNPYENFLNQGESMKLLEYENRLNGLFDKLNVTPTDLDARFGTAFSRKDMTGYLLKYTRDPHHPEFEDALEKVYTTDHVLDLRMAVAVIQKHQINAIIISSVDLAVILAMRLIQCGYTSPITFIIGTYFYNYDPATGLMNRVNEVTSLEFKYKHEFGVFDPFTGLNDQRKLEENI